MWEEEAHRRAQEDKRLELEEICLAAAETSMKTIQDLVHELLAMLGKVSINLINSHFASLPLRKL